MSDPHFATVEVAANFVSLNNFLNSCIQKNWRDTTLFVCKQGSAKNEKVLWIRVIEGGYIDWDISSDIQVGGGSFSLTSLFETCNW